MDCTVLYPSLCVMLSRNAMLPVNAKYCHHYPTRQTTNMFISRRPSAIQQAGAHNARRQALPHLVRVYRPQRRAQHVPRGGGPARYRQCLVLVTSSSHVRPHSSHMPTLHILAVCFLFSLFLFLLLVLFPFGKVAVR